MHQKIFGVLSPRTSFSIYTRFWSWQSTHSVRPSSKTENVGFRLSIFDWGRSKVGSIYKWVGHISHRLAASVHAGLIYFPGFTSLTFFENAIPVMDSRGSKVIWWQPKKFASDWPLMVFNLTFQMVWKFNNLILRSYLGHLRVCLDFGMHE